MLYGLLPESRTPAATPHQDVGASRPRHDGHADRYLVDTAVELYAQARASRYRLFDDVVDTPAELRGRLQKLALITNGPGDTQRHKLAATNIESYFDAIVISGEVGVAKPASEIFDIAARQLGVPVCASWHVGDNMATDVAGAQTAGLGAAIWLNRSRRSST